jgi:hypothetical protein
VEQKGGPMKETELPPLHPMPIHVITMIASRFQQHHRGVLGENGFFAGLLRAEGAVKERQCPALCRHRT